ncbi:MAG: hypothetical protein RLZ98_1703 [Pseudomonadota bacterium]|jgi:hypothetical protein
MLVRVWSILVLVAAWAIVPGSIAGAQDLRPGEFDIPRALQETAPPRSGNTTVIPRQTTPPAEKGAEGTLVRLEAVLTEEGERIDEGLMWRVFRAMPDKSGKPVLVTKRKEAAPAIRLAAGDYYVHVSYGQAYVTRRISAGDPGEKTEKFVLNAGGLRITAIITSATPAPDTAVQYDIYSEERDQYDNPSKIVSGARAGVIVRLNSGLYRIESRYGQANATVQANVTVEPGKLTDVSVRHEAARVTFKLVTREGGDALASTQWAIQKPDGATIVKSAGALPTHVLAPGAYTVIAQSDGRTFRRDFAVENGQTVVIELLYR